MKFKQLVAIVGIALATVATANVSSEMFQMNRELGGLLKAKTVESFEQSAEKFLAAAKKAQQTMPSSLDDNQERFKGYQQGMQELIDTLLDAKKLASEGKLDEAKEMAKKLNQLKGMYHAKYK